MIFLRGFLGTGAGGGGCEDSNEKRQRRELWSNSTLKVGESFKMNKRRRGTEWRNKRNKAEK